MAALRLDTEVTSTPSHHKENLMTTSGPGSPAIATAPGLALDRSAPVSANTATAVFGQVMGLSGRPLGPPLRRSPRWARLATPSGGT